MSHMPPAGPLPMPPLQEMTDCKAGEEGEMTRRIEAGWVEVIERSVPAVRAAIAELCDELLPNPVSAVPATPTVSVSPARNEVVLWEGAAHTERNIRLARTRSAYLEAHGDVLAAMDALKDSGNPVARSTFYNHLDAIDAANPRWGWGQLSK